MTTRSGNADLASMDAQGAPAGELALLLNGLQSPINIGMILRVAETYRAGVAIAGSDAVLDNPEKLQTIGDFACGALERRGFARAPGIEAMLERLSGRRLIATTIEPHSQALTDFTFEAGDIVLLGNEYDGLPADVARRCSHAIRIPMADVWTPKPPSRSAIDPTRTQPVAHDGAPNLNVSMAAGIVCYQWFVGTQRS